MKFAYQVGARAYAIDLEKTDGGYRARVDGQELQVRVLEAERGKIRFAIAERVVAAHVALNGARWWVHLDGKTIALDAARAGVARSSGDAAPSVANELRAPMPALVRAVYAREGDVVEKGQTLLIIEAMKMEIRIQAPRAGRVAKLFVQQGKMVEREQVLVEIE